MVGNPCPAACTGVCVPVTVSRAEDACELIKGEQAGWESFLPSGDSKQLSGGTGQRVRRVGDPAPAARPTSSRVQSPVAQPLTATRRDASGLPEALRARNPFPLASGKKVKIDGLTGEPAFDVRCVRRSARRDPGPPKLPLPHPAIHFPSSRKRKEEKNWEQSPRTARHSITRWRRPPPHHTTAAMISGSQHQVPAVSAASFAVLFPWFLLLCSFVRGPLPHQGTVNIIRCSAFDGLNVP